LKCEDELGRMNSWITVIFSWQRNCASLGLENRI